ncbi:MAG: tRNA (adenosine(37)-N6)-dimethylallyltransferase MiaA [Congregibacter sp.]
MLLCIMGPTASGKTDLAIALAEALHGELISVDSALVYRGLDIGSAKPAFPHHLIDICEPTEVYSAARFASDARAAIADIRARGRRPILVGGTVLYFRALLMGFDAMPEADPVLRAELEARAERSGWLALHEELAAIDPISAARIHPNHSQRLLRALEVCHLSGQPMSALQRQNHSPEALGEPVLTISLAPTDRRVLHRRIKARFIAMMEAGFLREVAELRERGDLHPKLPAVKAVGYRQLWAHLDGRATVDEAVEQGIAATRQLAKRQLTWLRKWPDLKWLKTDAAGRLVHSDLISDVNCARDIGEGMDTCAHELADEVLNYLRADPS